MRFITQKSRNRELCGIQLLISSWLFGGEGGSRTHDTFPYTHFPGVLLRPLGHLTEFPDLIIQIM